MRGLLVVLLLLPFGLAACSFESDTVQPQQPQAAHTTVVVPSGPSMAPDSSTTTSTTVTCPPGGAC